MNLRGQAQNPETPPEVLQELASSSDMEVRAAVAKNPNTPTDVLMELGATSLNHQQTWHPQSFNPNQTPITAALRLPK